ncbi:hypothetical protein C3942_00645 [Solimonas fluminis]|uniref:Uncharacterized protein n=1 Tax=Solimonas fluminis TaxID=2086571 RepID=A0A2S5TKA8_9GAMM|nr:hypothetical protein [Solimonas fluminis]PPE75436.1 hypothetical protein C3942_00645 [Solimonas fluminis]
MSRPKLNRETVILEVAGEEVHITILNAGEDAWSIVEVVAGSFPPLSYREEGYPTREAAIQKSITIAADLLGA